MQTTMDDHGLKQMKGALRDAIERRFGSMKSVPNLLAASLLDPRFKDMYFSKQEKDAATDKIKNYLRQQRRDVNTDLTHPNATSDESSASTTADSAEQPPPASPTLLIPETSLWDEHDKFATGMLHLH